MDLMDRIILFSIQRLRISRHIVIFAAMFLLVQGISTMSVAAESQITPLGVVSNPLEMQFHVAEPESYGSDQDNRSPLTSEKLTVIVDTGNGSGGSTATIERTKDANGNVKDEVTFELNQAKETVEKAKELGHSNARIVIPDPKDEVSRLDLNIPRESTEQLANGGLQLEISTDNANIVIPNESLQGLAEDLYFRVIPIKDEAERTEVEERARVEKVVMEVAGDNHIYVVARPMTIETNLTSRAVDIVLPLLNVSLPTDLQERDAFLADLVIFIEHSDGDRQLVKPQVVDYKGGQLGLKFGIHKFSTFTILNMEGWEEYIRAQEASNQHFSYMEGYPDQTFRPDRSITRAEMAMILHRLEAGAVFEDGEMIRYADTAPDHWAQEAIQYVSSKGLMTGYPDGRFKPEQTMTRAEMAEVVTRWLELQGEPATSFNDVVGHRAEKVIALAEARGIIQGLTDGSFHPEKTLTRAEAVTMINKILKRGSQDWTTSIWIDVPLEHWALKDIEEASVLHRFIQDANGLETIRK
jgi:hypothetical protein